MPIYQCCSPKRLLTKSVKGKIAGEITRIHCEVTGERPSFVNVLFLDIPEGTSFNAGRPSTRSFVMGEIRHGHDVQTRHALLRDLSQMWTRLTGQSARYIRVTATKLALRAGDYILALGEVMVLNPEGPPGRCDSTRAAA